MNLTVAELRDENRVAEVKHSELLQFLRAYMRVLNPWVVSYWAANAAACIAFIVYLIYQPGNVDSIMSGIGLGFVFFFIPLLPLHEFIHGMAYKLMGAGKVQYKADFRQLMFYALADRFVVNRREFIWIAILPFVVINTLLIAGIVAVEGKWDVILFGSLILHISGCFGDFALISFFYQHREKALVTFDDAAGEKTLFYTV